MKESATDGAADPEQKDEALTLEVRGHRRSSICPSMRPADTCVVQSVGMGPACEALMAALETPPSRLLACRRQPLPAVRRKKPFPPVGGPSPTKPKGNPAAGRGWSGPKSPVSPKGQQQAPAAAPAVALGDQQLVHLVLDSGAIIKGVAMSLTTKAQQFWTIPEVLAEIRDKRARASLAALPFRLETKEPSHEAMAFIVRFSQETGDFSTLSKTDLKVRADGPLSSLSCSMVNRLLPYRFCPTGSRSRLHA